MEYRIWVKGYTHTHTHTHTHHISSLGLALQGQRISSNGNNDDANRGWFCTRGGGDGGVWPMPAASVSAADELSEIEVNGSMHNNDLQTARFDEEKAVVDSSFNSRPSQVEAVMATLSP